MIQRLPGLTRWPHERVSIIAAAAFIGVLFALGVPNVAAAAEEEAGGIAALGFNLPGLVAQLINFGILLIVMRLFLFRPIMNMLDERKRRIQEGLNAAEQAAEQASASEEASEQVLAEARVEAQASLQRAQEAAGRLREELEARARTDADQIVVRAREEVQVERDQAIQQLRAEFADLTVRAAEQVINQSLDRSAHQQLIDEVLANSEFGQQN